MTERSDDVHDIIELGAEEGMRRFLPMALVLCCIGLVMVAGGDQRHTGRGWIVALLAGGFALFAFIRHASPGKPMVVLSPEGIRYRIGMVKEVMIPWADVRGVDTIDIKAWLPRVPWKVTYRDVNVVLVTKRFYDAHLHVGSLLLRGPAWHIHFIRKGHLVQIALHNEAFRWPPAELRKVLETRWLAFRGATATAESEAPASGASSSVPVVHQSPAAATLGPRPRVYRRSAPWTAWELIKVGVPLLGMLVAFANIVGAWETTPQQERRIAREKSDAEARRAREERKKEEEKWKNFWRDTGR